MRARRPAQGRDQRPLPDAGELRAAEEAGVKAVQVSLDGATRATFNRMRVLGEFDRASKASATCATPACRSRSTTRRRASTSTRSARSSTSPTSSARTASIPAARCTRAMPSRRGGISQLTDEQYDDVLRDAARKAEEYRGRMRVYFHEAGLLEELRYRLEAARRAAHRAAERARQAHQRPALHLRRSAAQSLAEIWANFQRAWHDPRVARVRRRPRRDPGKTRRCTNGSISERARRRARATSADAARSACCAWCRAGALPLLPLRGSVALSARRGVGVRDRGRLDAAVFWSGLVGRGAGGDRRRGVQRVFRRAHGHGPGVQSRRPAADLRRRVLAAAWWRSPARSRWASISAARRLADPRVRDPGRPCRDLLRGAADPLVVPRPGRGRDRVVVRPVDGAGSLYLHTRTLSWPAFAASLVPGFLIMSLAVVNAIPDYHQDLLVGKRNLVVRVGRARGVVLYLALAAAGLAVARSATLLGVFPVGASFRARTALSSRARARARGTYTSAAPVRARDPQHRRLLRGDGRAVHLGVSRTRHVRLMTFASTRSRRRSRRLAAHARLRPRVPALLHRVGAGQAPARRARRRRGDARRRGDHRRASAIRHAVRRRAAARPLLFRRRGGARPRGMQLKIETNGQRLDAAMAARLAALPIAPSR